MDTIIEQVTTDSIFFQQRTIYTYPDTHMIDHLQWQINNLTSMQDYSLSFLLGWVTIITMIILAILGTNLWKYRTDHKYLNEQLETILSKTKRDIDKLREEATSEISSFFLGAMMPVIHLAVDQNQLRSALISYTMLLRLMKENMPELSDVQEHISLIISMGEKILEGLSDQWRGISIIREVVDKYIDSVNEINTWGEEWDIFKDKNATVLCDALKKELDDINDKG